MSDLRSSRAVLLGVMSCAWWSAAATAQPGPQAVTVTPITQREIASSVRLVGTVLPNHRSVVAAEVSGIVSEFATREGDYRKRGDVICRLNAEPFELRLAEARGRWQVLNSRLQLLENGEREEDIRRAEALVEAAEAVYGRWEFELNRVRALAERDRTNPVELKETEMEYLSAKRLLASERAARDRMKNGARAEEIAAARYEVAAQQAVVQRLERDARLATITAPFDGFVITKRSNIGEWLEQGGAVCEMVAVDVVRIRADAPEGAIRYAAPGVPVSIEIDALEWSTEATLTRVIPQASAAARTFPIEVQLPNPDQKLLPGMFVWLIAPAGENGARLMVSRDAVATSGAAKTVFVIRPGQGGGSMAVPVSVVTGLARDGDVEVRGAGLLPGDLCVSRGNERLFGPTPVTILNPPDAPAGDPAASPAQPPQ